MATTSITIQAKRKGKEAQEYTTGNRRLLER